MTYAIQPEADVLRVTFSGRVPTNLFMPDMQPHIEPTHQAAGRSILLDVTLQISAPDALKTLLIQLAAHPKPGMIVLVGANPVMQEELGEIVEMLRKRTPVHFCATDTEANLRLQSDDEPQNPLPGGLRARLKQ